MSEAIYQFHEDFGRMGEVSGTFIEDKELVETVIEFEHEVYLGEVLGKHSDISVELTKDNVTMLSDNPEHIKLLREIFKGDNISGMNPFDQVDMEDFK